MANRTYVPGYGYVDDTSSNTGSARGSAANGRGSSSSNDWTWLKSTVAEQARIAATKTTPIDGSQRGKATEGDPPSPTNQSLTNPTVPAYLRNPVAYRPPVYGTADSQERQIPSLPLLYRIQTSGDLREAYWSDPESRAIIEAAARIYYRDYPNYSDQWAKNFWQKDILGASMNPGAPPPWQALQQIFEGTLTADGKNGSDGPGSSSGGEGSYGGGGGGGGGGSVSLTNPTSARGLLMQTMQGVLGRNPTEAEYSDFLKALNESQMNNPMTVTMDGNNVVQSGGVDPNVLALEFAQGAEDYKSREASKYYNMFMSALGGAGANG